MQIPVVSHFWCVLTATLGPLLCALDDEGGCLSIVLVFQPMFISADVHFLPVIQCARSQAPSHVDVSHVPIYLLVMFHEPHMP